MAKNTIRELQIKAQEDGNAAGTIADTYAKEVKDTTGMTEEEIKAAEKAKQDAKDAAAAEAHKHLSAEELDNLAANKRLIAAQEAKRPKNLADRALSALKMLKGK